MQHAELATRLVNSSDSNRETLLSENAVLADVELAYKLKDICLEGWSTHPAQALGAAASLQLLSDLRTHPEIKALAAWAAGLQALIRGEMELAISELEDSERGFLSLGKTHTAAATRVSKLIALSMLGRYEEAIECGLHAREVFLSCNDVHAAGKIEHNIGNLYFRRDRYHEAEIFQSAARDRFAAVNDQKQLATVNNCLANTHALLHKFKSAEDLFEQALQQAEEAGQPVTLAGIEGSIGLFALLQGRYDRALDFLERSRQHYNATVLDYNTAIATIPLKRLNWASIWSATSFLAPAADCSSRRTVSPRITDLPVRRVCRSLRSALPWPARVQDAPPRRRPSPAPRPWTRRPRGA